LVLPQLEGRGEDQSAGGGHNLGVPKAIPFRFETLQGARTALLDRLFSAELRPYHNCIQ
jgi:hypothetical protein